MFSHYGFGRVMLSVLIMILLIALMVSKTEARPQPKNELIVEATASVKRSWSLEYNVSYSNGMIFHNISAVPENGVNTYTTYGTIKVTNPSKHNVLVQLRLKQPGARLVCTHSAKQDRQLVSLGRVLKIMSGDTATCSYTINRLMHAVNIHLSDAGIVHGQEVTALSYPDPRQTVAGTSDCIQVTTSSLGKVSTGCSSRYHIRVIEPVSSDNCKLIRSAEIRTDAGIILRRKIRPVYQC